MTHSLCGRHVADEISAAYKFSVAGLQIVAAEIFGFYFV